MPLEKPMLYNCLLDKKFISLLFRLSWSCCCTLRERNDFLPLEAHQTPKRCIDISVPIWAINHHWLTDWYVLQGLPSIWYTTLMWRRYTTLEIMRSETEWVDRWVKAVVLYNMYITDLLFNDLPNFTIPTDHACLSSIYLQPGAVKLVLWRHWMHVTKVHSVT